MRMNAHEAETHVSRLLLRVDTRQEVGTARGDTLVASLVLAWVCQACSFWSAPRGLLVSEDFNARLSMAKPFFGSQL